MIRDLDPAGCERLLVRILADTDQVTGAACVGHSALFDARSAHEPIDIAEARHHAAVALCRRCPAITGCREFTSGLRDIGMVRAGVRPRLSQREVAP